MTFQILSNNRFFTVQWYATFIPPHFHTLFWRLEKSRIFCRTFLTKKLSSQSVLGFKIWVFNACLSKLSFGLNRLRTPFHLCTGCAMSHNSVMSDRNWFFLFEFDKFEFRSRSIEYEYPRLQHGCPSQLASSWVFSN